MKRKVESVSISITYLLFALTLLVLYFKEVQAIGEITGHAVFLLSLGILSIVLFMFFSLSVLITPLFAKYEEWFQPPFKSSIRKWLGLAIFLTLWIAVFINFVAGFLPAISELPEFLHPTAVGVVVWWPLYVSIALVIGLIESRWKLFSILWQIIKQTKPIRQLVPALWALLMKRMSFIAENITNWSKYIFRSLLKRPVLGVFGVVVILSMIAFGIIWIAEHYRSGEFSYEFTTGILATLIGVLLGALSAIFVSLFIVNPLVKRKEEQRLEPLRTPILKFWDHHLTMYTTSLLMGLNLRREITQVISDINSQIMTKTDSYADEQKLIDLQRLLLESDINEELVLWTPEAFQDSLKDYKDFLSRMHETVVAVPYVFQETPDIAIGLEILAGNFISGLKMLEYKTKIENNTETTRLSFYSANIIKMSACDAFKLVREIRQARFKHQ